MWHISFKYISLKASNMALDQLGYYDQRGKKNFLGEDKKPEASFKNCT